MMLLELFLLFLFWVSVSMIDRPKYMSLKQSMLYNKTFIICGLITYASLKYPYIRTSFNTMLRVAAACLIGIIISRLIDIIRKA